MKVKDLLKPLAAMDPETEVHIFDAQNETSISTVGIALNKDKIPAMLIVGSGSNWPDDSNGFGFPFEESEYREACDVIGFNFVSLGED